MLDDYENELMEGWTICDKCNTKVYYNDNGYECEFCGHSCC